MANLLQDALALIILKKQAILERLEHLATGDTCSFEHVAAVLRELCSSEVDWRRIFFEKRLVSGQEAVVYGELLDSVRLHWSSEVERMVRALLVAEIQLDGLSLGRLGVGRPRRPRW